MVQTRSRLSRNMEDRILALEKKINKVDELQDTVWGLRDELRPLVQAAQIQAAQNNGSQRWIRQLGSVKEYNKFFDDAVTRFQLQMPEEYLVEAYMGGLKEEILDSVELFQPRTMREARSIARAEEIFLQWRLEKARRVLKDKEDGGAALPLRREQAEIIQEESQEVSLVIQEPNVTHKECGSCSESTRECVQLQETKEMAILQVLHGLEKSEGKDTRASQELSHATDLREVMKAKNLGICERFQKESLKEPSVSAPSTTTSSLLTPILILPSSLSSLQKGSCVLKKSEDIVSQVRDFLEQDFVVLDATWLYVSVCIGPLGSFPSLLSLFQSLGPRSLQSIDYSHISTKSELVMRQAEELTWLGLIELEKSKAQLASIFPTFQLSCNFSLWQKNIVGLQLDSFSSVSGVTDQNMGFNFQENGPSLLQQWVNSAKPVYVSIHWSFHVKLSCTRTLLQLWFKGKLIVMLYGRFCSLRGKDKKMPKG